MILAYCEPVDTKDIIDELKKKFVSNLRNWFRAQPQLSDSQVFLSYVLQEINEHLKTMSQHATLSQFRLSNAHSGLLPFIPFSSQQNPSELRQSATEAIKRFNPEMRKIFNAVVQAVPQKPWIHIWIASRSPDFIQRNVYLSRCVRQHQKNFCYKNDSKISKVSKKAFLRSCFFDWRSSTFHDGCTAHLALKLLASVRSKKHATLTSILN